MSIMMMMLIIFYNYIFSIISIICYAQGSKLEHGYIRSSELKTTNTKNLHNNLKRKKLLLIIKSRHKCTIGLPVIYQWPMNIF